MRYLLALSAPLAVGGFMLAPQLLDFLYGARNAGALPAFQVLVWVIPLQYVSEFLGYVVLVKGNERLATRSLLISTSCNVMINLVLVPRYGFMAAAVVTVITEAVLVLQYLWILRAEIRQFDVGMVLLRPLLAAGAVFLALLASHSLPFLAQLAVGVVVGGSCLLLLKVFGRQELQMILRMRAGS
jgi:O-antigen/teichoic acid export membrane protein